MSELIFLRVFYSRFVWTRIQTKFVHCTLVSYALSLLNLYSSLFLLFMCHLLVEEPGFIGPSVTSHTVNQTHVRVFLYLPISCKLTIPSRGFTFSFSLSPNQILLLLFLQEYITGILVYYLLPWNRRHTMSGCPIFSDTKIEWWIEYQTDSPIIKFPIKPSPNGFLSATDDHCLDLLLLKWWSASFTYFWKLWLTRKKNIVSLTIWLL